MQLKKLLVIIVGIFYIAQIVPITIEEIKNLMNFGYNFGTDKELGTTLPFQGYDRTKGYILIVLNLCLIISTLLIFIKASGTYLIVFLGWNIPPLLLLLYHQLKYLSKGYELEVDKWKSIFVSIILISSVFITFFAEIRKFTTRQYVTFLVMIIVVLLLFLRIVY